MNWFGSPTGPQDDCNEDGKGYKLYPMGTWVDYPIIYAPWCKDFNCTGKADTIRSCPVDLLRNTLFVIIFLGVLLVLMTTTMCILSAINRCLIIRQRSRAIANLDEYSPLITSVYINM